MQLGTFSFQTTKDVQNLINILKEEEIYPLYKKGEEVYIPLKPEAVGFHGRNVDKSRYANRTIRRWACD